MDKKLIISGCSYTDGYDWPDYLWTDYQITNLAKSGATNRYISDSIINAIDLQNKPAYVFILWSGLNKLDLILPVSPITSLMAKQHCYVGRINHSYYFFDGGDTTSGVVIRYNQIKDPSWPNIKNLADFFMLPINIKEECIKAGIFQMSQVNIADVNDYVPLAFMLYRLYHDNKYYNDQSIQAIVNCTTFLEHHQIPYQFSFCCDVFANHANTNLLQGQIDKTNPNFSRIPWQKYVKLTPYEFGLKHDLLSQDNFHLTSEGMKKWADQIKKYLQRKK